MNHTYTISLNAVNGLGVLPRIALVFSRRRLTISHLRMHESETQGLARLPLGLDTRVAHPGSRAILARLTKALRAHHLKE